MAPGNGSLGCPEKRGAGSSVCFVYLFVFQTKGAFDRRRWETPEKDEAVVSTEAVWKGIVRESVLAPTPHPGAG